MRCFCNNDCIKVKDFDEIVKLFIAINKRNNSIFSVYKNLFFYSCEKCNIIYHFYENSAFGIIDAKLKINIRLWLYENRTGTTFINCIEKFFPKKYSQEEFINAYIKYKGNLIFE